MPCAANGPEELPERMAEAALLAADANEESAKAERWACCWIASAASDWAASGAELEITRTSDTDEVGACPCSAPLAVESSAAAWVCDARLARTPASEGFWADIVFMWDLKGRVEDRWIQVAGRE